MKPIKQKQERKDVTCTISKDEKMITILSEQIVTNCDPVALEKSCLGKKKK